MQIDPIFFLLVCGFISAFLLSFLPKPYKPLFLFIISLGFCFWLSWQFSILIVVFSGFVYFFAIQINHSKNKAWLWLGIIFCLLFLLVLKYQKEAIGLGRLVLIFSGNAHESELLTFAVPIGISFLAVQAIMLLLEIYRNQQQKIPPFSSVFLLLTFFPKIIAGPLERPRKFLDQINNLKPATKNQISAGLTSILIGLFRKFVIANPLGGLIPEDVFFSPVNFTGPSLWMYLITYAFFLYNDFTGYSYLVRGIGQLMGIELTQNFQIPFLAQNFSEFWSRWHISLSNFLREYIYFPISRKLAANRKGSNKWMQVVIPPLFTMIASGAWHGLSWHMFLWGGMYGVYLIIERLFIMLRPKARQRKESLFGRWVNRAGIFILVLIAWIPFRMNLETAAVYFMRMFSIHEIIRPTYLILRGSITGASIHQWLAVYSVNWRIYLFLGVAVLLDIAQNADKDKLIGTNWSAWKKACIAALCISIIIVISFAGNSAPFIYQGF